MGVFKEGAQEGPFGLRTCLAEEFVKDFPKDQLKEARGVGFSVCLTLKLPRISFCFGTFLLNSSFKNT